MDTIVGLIDSYLDRGLTYDEFFSAISKLYTDDNPTYSALSEPEQDFIYEVYEKATYTAEGLPKNDPDRRYGVIDQENFRVWLKEKKKDNISFWDL